MGVFHIDRKVCPDCRSKNRVLILLVAMMAVIGAAVVSLVDRMTSIQAYTELQESCSQYIDMANTQLALMSRNCPGSYSEGNISISSYCFRRCADDGTT